MKKLQSNFTTPEQSKRLLELGVPADSADCIGFICRNNYDLLRKGVHISVLHDRDTYTKAISPDEYGGQPVEEPFPCWSVGRLMEIFDICNLYELHKFSTRDWSVNIKKLMRDYEVAAEENKLDFSKLEE